MDLLDGRNEKTVGRSTPESSTDRSRHVAHPRPELQKYSTHSGAWRVSSCSKTMFSNFVDPLPREAKLFRRRFRVDVFPGDRTSQVATAGRGEDFVCKKGCFKSYSSCMFECNELGFDGLEAHKTFLGLCRGRCALALGLVETSTAVPLALLLCV